MLEPWREIAKLRSVQIESGLDLTFSKVFVPYFQNLITRLKPKKILEVGGGTGHLAKILSDISQKYVMVEPSIGMYHSARNVLAGTQVEIFNSAIETF